MSQAQANMAAVPMIELRDVRVTYRVRGSSWFHRRWIHALDGVSVQLSVGRTLGIVGESGSGKSTLAKVLIGLEQPTSGDVLLAGTVVPRFTAAVRPRR